MNNSKIINKKTIFSFILGLLLSATTVYGITLIQSDTVGYDNTNSGLKNNNGENITDVKAAMDELYSVTYGTSSGETSECEKGYRKIDIDEYKYKCAKNELFEPKKITLKVGDVVKMTPTLNSYKTDKSYTGYKTSQTINPQLLNIWRVIRVNSNGTYDAVSEYVSYEKIYFGEAGNPAIGKIPYKYYIYYLNILASKYENSNFTVGSRYMGYNGQTEILTNDSYYDCPSTAAGTDWQASTSSSTSSAHEAIGRGDMLYTTDVNLVNNQYGGNAIAYEVDASGEPTAQKAGYWLASRYYNWSATDDFSFECRYITTSTQYQISGVTVTSYFKNGCASSGENNKALRPIITLKSDLTASGIGTINYPYLLQ